MVASDRNRRRKGNTRIAPDTPEKNEIENNKMKKAKTVKTNIMAELITSNEVHESEEEVSDTYSLHDSDTSVGTEVFSDSDEEDLRAITLDPTKVSQIKTGDFIIVRLQYDAVSNKAVDKYFIILK